VAAWLVSSLLSDYEYKKSLSEAIYSHQIFWTLNLIILIIVTSLQFETIGLVNEIFQVFQIILNFFLCILMVMTKRRTVEKPRPRNHLYDSVVEPLRNTTSSKNKSASKESQRGMEIEIKMGKRFFEQEGVLVFEFCIRIKEKGVDYKVQKTYNQFIELDEFIKQEFIPSKYPLIISKKDFVPTLQKEYLSHQTPKNLRTDKKSNSSLLSFTGHTDKIFINWVENLESFLKAILSNRLFHCREILNFCKIPEELQSQFLSERSAFLEAKNPNLKMAGSYENDRTQSYMSNQSDLNEIKEEEEGKEMEFKEGHKNDFELIDDYVAEAKSSPNDSNSLSRIPFEVSILNWQLSNQGDYKEFVIQIDYKEGDGSQWKITKRYREFVELHENLHEQFNKRGKSSMSSKIPKLPPKIQNENEQALEGRRKQLQIYLQSVINMGDFPQILLQFLEFIDNSQSNPRVTEFDSFTLTEYQEKKIRIIQNKVKIVNQKPKTFFILEISLIHRKLNQTKSLSNRVSNVKSNLLNRLSNKEDSQQSQVFRLQKSYKDFKVLNHVIIETFKDDFETLKSIPNLPQKKSELGSELPTQVLSVKLEQYINEVVQNKVLEKLVCLQQFLWDGYMGYMQNPVSDKSLIGSKKSTMNKAGLTLSSRTINESQRN